ncbi:MAG: hypothetical protein HRU72_11655 [Planctomycetia bacterium]|uniref:Uncharacterized protein n=1 Tax=Candidatus Brocadia sapporoensis TaxID=392547 RepID=A0A1V6LZ89_9BACT|nr:hypothetical protein [Candidatus Brocadia sapporoensis]MCC7238534.1 hypothetical protein [Candidatus Brocadia sp.]QOJ07145.1 MAG: hypothetical protein HRU72_11655 [Planctomycetia bacterium]TVL96410.1 MAG: hypothetical protein CV082_07210 [Candidatus Brocadia sp. BL1]MDG6005010.1 hypothetical protein [Candidatus Brocadia sp.]OQD45449.1 hypothetical protein BIY37_08415 [Candidatus Brocadia sapporoensis]
MKQSVVYKRLKTASLSLAMTITYADIFVKRYTRHNPRPKIGELTLKESPVKLITEITHATYCDLLELHNKCIDFHSAKRLG